MLNRYLALLLLAVSILPLQSSAAEPQLMLAKHWDKSIDPTGWLISEKYDGIRAYWDGEKLLSRKGNPLKPPKWFIKSMPDFPIDGELWIGRNKFSQLASVVKKFKGNRSENWKKVLFMVFDAPKRKGDFNSRYFKLKQWFGGRKTDHIRLVKQTRCKSPEHLKRELAMVEKRGGEGLMIRQPESQHIAGRSGAILKVKSWHDSEGTVIGYVKGRGQFRGMMGALKIKMPDGKTFSLGSGFSRFQRQQPPKIGSTVTYRYRGFHASGLPRFTSFVRVRQDI
ncbi:DNA ligase [Pelagibaculum spongiae]|uniref:DNA ligase n=1 Tax=Pelagibaculum spongiae TaxID=2080658 RepID=A0A2V1H2B4_9GAMM|nr:DNA ligase [Pelagibaculum spongiae]PVZ70582.1 DNA ligase [Pelagibaculum spongiae]